MLLVSLKLEAGSTDWFVTCQAACLTWSMQRDSWSGRAEKTKVNCIVHRYRVGLTNEAKSDKKETDEDGLMGIS